MWKNQISMKLWILNRTNQVDKNFYEDFSGPIPPKDQFYHSWYTITLSEEVNIQNLTLRGMFHKKHKTQYYPCSKGTTQMEL